MTIKLPVSDSIQGFDWVNGIRRMAEALNYIYRNGQLRAKSYTVATLPSASIVGEGAMVYVSDAATAPCIAFSNGSVWKRCDDSTVTVT